MNLYRSDDGQFLVSASDDNDAAGVITSASMALTALNFDPDPSDPSYNEIMGLASVLKQVIAYIKGRDATFRPIYPTKLLWGALGPDDIVFMVDPEDGVRRMRSAGEWADYLGRGVVATMQGTDYVGQWGR